MMITPPQAVTALISLASLAMAGFLWHSYTRWRLDLFREQLFEIRGELFDYAATGNIAFGNPSYVMLRTMVNGLLRFGHRIDGIPFLVFMVRVAESTSDSSSFVVRWNREAMKLDVDQRTTLEDFQRRVHVAILEQTVLSSFLLACVSALLLIAAGLHALAGRAKRRFNAPFGRFYDRHSVHLDARLMRPLDDLAFEEGLVAA